MTTLRSKAMQEKYDAYIAEGKMGERCVLCRKELFEEAKRKVEDLINKKIRRINFYEEILFSVS